MQAAPVDFKRRSGFVSPIIQSKHFYCLLSGEMDGSKGFTEGDNVELLDDRLIIVARGFVSFVDANRTCHSVKVGPTRSVIRISEALDLEARLPYAHPDAETVNAGKGSNALWDTMIMGLT